MQNSNVVNLVKYSVIILLALLYSTDSARSLERTSGPLPDQQQELSPRADDSKVIPALGSPNLRFKRSWVVAAVSCAACGAQSPRCHAACGRGPGTRACHDRCRSQLNACKRSCTRGGGGGSASYKPGGKVVSFKSEVEPPKWSATISGWFVKPKGNGPFPTIIFLHACAGLSKPSGDSISAHANYMKKYGFASFVLDSFSARKLSGGQICKGTYVTRLAYEFRVDDAFNALRRIQKIDFVSKDNIFLVGQSHGAGSAMIAARADANKHDEAFRAVAAYYPPCRHLGFNSKLKSPLIAFGGGRDDWASFDTCQHVAKHKLTSGKEYIAILYPNALHGFDLLRKPFKSFGHLLGRNAKATADSRSKMREFFTKYLTDDLKKK